MIHEEQAMPIESLKTLSPTHRLLCTLVAAGRSVEEACESTGMAVTYWKRIRNDPLVKQELESVHEQAREAIIQAFANDPVRAELQMLAPEAVGRIRMEMNNEDGRAADRLRACENVLDRSGFAKTSPSSVHLEKTVINISANQMKAIEELAQSYENNDAAKDEQPYIGVDADD